VLTQAFNSIKKSEEEKVLMDSLKESRLYERGQDIMPLPIVTKFQEDLIKTV